MNQQTMRFRVSSVIALCSLIVTSPTTAQVVPDATLPSNSSITSEDNTNTINGGTRAGSNLLHSFEQFSVPTGSAAYFNNAQDIQNIISRVTGESISNIDGLIRANGTANLFLLNPNGIVFGSNAALNIGGSFLGSTASSLNFSDGKFFSATAPQTTPLLSVNVTRGLQIGGNTSSIRLQNSRLQVQPGKTLALLGGNVRLDSGSLQAPGGRVELGGVATGTVGLVVDSNNLQLNYPAQGQRADISLSNRASVDVTAGGGGSIAVNARNLDISGSSDLVAGLRAGSGSVNSQAGNIEIDVTDKMTISGASDSNSPTRIRNLVNTGASGTAGNIVINTGSLNAGDNTEIGSVTNGQGNAGSVTIQARDTIAFSGSSGVFSAVAQSGVGNGSDINIQTRKLSLTDGTQLTTSTLGQGNAGNIQVNVTDSISASGGSGLLAASLGQGSAGDVSITAGGTVSFDGVGTNLLPSGVTDDVLVSSGFVGNGNAGNISISAGSLSLTNGARIGTSNFGQGDAGNIQVNATNSISVSSGSTLQAVTLGQGQGQGNAGNIALTAGGEVSFDGFLGGAFSFIGPGVVGKGGDVNIQAQSLSLTNGAQLATNTLGQGDAGNIQVNVTDSIYASNGSGFQTTTLGQGNGGNVSLTAGGKVSFTGETTFPVNGVDFVAPSGIATYVGISPRLLFSIGGLTLKAAATLVELLPESGGIGKGGNISIQAGSLFLNDRALLSSSTLGQGDAGSISVRANDSVSLVNSNIVSTVESSGVGNGADISIQTGELALTNEAEVSASSEGTGVAGNLNITARSIQLNTGKLTAETASGQSGEIKLQVQDLLLMQRNSQISTTAGTAQAGGNGGNIGINTDLIVAVPSENSDITANAFEGNGGNINITAQGIFGLEFREQRTPQSDITASSELGLNGVVELSTPDVDLSRGLASLPVVPTNVEVVQACQPGGSQAQSEFVVTGRGGLPPNPTEALSSDAVQVDWVTLNPRLENQSSRFSPNPTSIAPAPLVEAQGWAINAKGEVVLIAQASTAASRSFWQTPTDCHTPTAS